AGRLRALVARERLELGERLERRVAARGLIDLDDRVALAALHGHGDDLLGQAALVGRRNRALVAAQRPAVEVGAGHLELVGDLAGLLEHLLAAERVAQAVVYHSVDGLRVAQPEAEAVLLEQLRRVAHRLHAAGDADVEVAGPDRGVD